jgi:hypothetical protein
MTSLEKEEIHKLRQYLVRFKELTIELIECLEKGYYDSLEELYDKRQYIIDDIDKLKYSKEFFKAISIEQQLMPLQQKLTMLMNQRKTEARHELDTLSASKTASKSYNTKHKVDSLFFNKKI